MAGVDAEPGLGLADRPERGQDLVEGHAGRQLRGARRLRAERRGGTAELSPGVTLDEVLATFRAIGEAQARFRRGCLQ